MSKRVYQEVQAIRKAQDILEAVTIAQRAGYAGVKFRCILTTGSYKHSRYTTDKEDLIINVCKKYGFRYYRGNDAPHGGKLGKYILVW